MLNDALMTTCARDNLIQTEKYEIPDELCGTTEKSLVPKGNAKGVDLFFTLSGTVKYCLRTLLVCCWMDGGEADTPNQYRNSIRDHKQLHERASLQAALQSHEELKSKCQSDIAVEP